MHYILNENIALRSWWLVPYAYYVKNDFEAKGLKKDEFEILQKCDGLQDIEESGLVKNLCDRGFIHPVEKGAETLTEWQKYLNCENRYVPIIDWMITGRCNYNCLHCFNAKDNAPLQSEYTSEEAENLIEQAQKCGVATFKITGGEPLLHPYFLQIVKEIYKRGMYIYELNTNGFFISEKILDEMKETGCNPLVKISFDGIGFHDWMRGKKGAEEDTIRAIKLCKQKGFDVKIQMNINRKNKDSILPSLEMLDQLGVDETRIIVTTPAPRWEQNAAGQCMTTKEYYDKAIEISKEYIKKTHSMELDFWEFLQLDPENKTYNCKALQGCNMKYRDTMVLCKCNRATLNIAADGEVYPCMQWSGYMKERGISFGNVKKQSMQKILQSSNYVAVFGIIHNSIDF